MPLRPNTLVLLSALGCLATGCSERSPADGGSGTDGSGDDPGDANGDVDDSGSDTDGPFDFPYDSCADAWELPAPEIEPVPLPPLDPADVDGPRIEAAFRADPRGERLAIVWSEPLANPEDVDPDDFRFAHRGWGTGKFYGDVTYELADEQAVAAIPDPVRTNRVELLLSSPLPFVATCDSGCPDANAPYGTACSAPTVHFRPGATPPTDVNGNAAEALDEWIFDAVLPTTHGVPFEPYLAVERCGGFVEMTLIDEEVVDDSTLRLEFDQPVANVCDVDLRQFNLRVREAYDFDCDCSPLGDCYFDPSGCIEHEMDDEVMITAAANDPDAPTEILLRTSGGLACGAWSTQPASLECSFVSSLGFETIASVAWNPDPYAVGLVRGLEGQYVVPRESKCVRPFSSATCTPRGTDKAPSSEPTVAAVEQNPDVASNDGDN